MHKFILAVESEPRPFYKDIVAIGSPPSNYKTDKAINDWTERRTEQIHEEAGTTPLLANVTGVHISDLANGDKVQTLDAKDAYEFVTNCSRDSVVFYAKQWARAWSLLVNSLLVDKVTVSPGVVPYCDSFDCIQACMKDPFALILGSNAQATIDTFVNYAKLTGLIRSNKPLSETDIIVAVLKFGQVIPA